MGLRFGFGFGLRVSGFFSKALGRMESRISIQGSRSAIAYAGIPSEFDNITTELSDRSLNGPQSAGIARGDETNNDWYSFSGITLSFRIKGNTKGCDY